MIKGFNTYSRIKIIVNDKKVKLFVTEKNDFVLDYGLFSFYLTSDELREIADYIDELNAQKSTTPKKAGHNTRFKKERVLDKK